MPQIETWEAPLFQPRMTSHGQWPYAAPPSTARSSTSRITPPLNRQRPDPTTWRQKRVGGTGGAVQRESTASLDDIAIPVEIALKRLFDALSACKSLYEEYQQLFQQQAGQTTSWAASGTLDKLWRDMIARHGDAARIQEVTDRFKGRLSSLKGVLDPRRSNHVEHSNLAKQNRGVLERRLWAARKAEVHCEGLLDLVYRAKMERMACTLLVEELSEVTAMLDPNTHPVLYFDNEEEKAESMKGKGPAQVRQNMKTRSQRGLRETAVMERQGDVNPTPLPPANAFGQSTAGLQPGNEGSEWEEAQPGEQETGDGGDDGWGRA
ncbi:hypothetical protein BR93DRAFT_969310 [Coniochaeta sp. PMI_546]|nr:hypothetical protein BR93DRAFT_969310 [Coniochaeta sp. PMI_546]